MIGFILVLGITLMLVWAIWYAILRLTKKQRLTGWSRFLGLIGLLFFVIGSVMSYDSEDNTKNTKANSTKSESATSGSKKTSAKKEHTVKDLDIINKKMEESLSEDQNYANSGNESYNYALEIKQWQLRKSGYIYIVIDGTKFYNETNLGTRQEFINKISNSANGAYSMASNDYDDSNKNIKVYVDGVDEPVAQSSISDHEPKLTKVGQR